MAAFRGDANGAEGLPPLDCIGERYGVILPGFRYVFGAAVGGWMLRGLGGAAPLLAIRANLHLSRQSQSGGADPSGGGRKGRPGEDYARKGKGGPASLSGKRSAE